ncbi:MAG: ATP phosphoribosyltransferase regulatory subunit [Lachnospiraceae bacterium]|nr:ATP phosphoribosyltransferase regulatory subunit [Lachnospiraceae bacterium]MDE5780701.1 ATP phosphoribosyltransferase regulatory subunit [Lachnospiraceae bacterium]
MENKLLHTPVGVRDIYNIECAKKLYVQEKIHQVFLKYGYRDIQTPTFEFFDIFSKERGSVASKDMYKFFDREGNTLVLRPDMTPPVSRAVSKYFSDEEMPIRLCYQADSYINNSEYQGKLKEFTQLGAELIGDNTSDADAEVIAIVIDSMINAGLKEFQVEVGQVDFFKGLVEENGIDEETEDNLRKFIENKNYFGMEEMISGTDIPEDKKQVFMKFSELYGSIDMLEEAKKLTNNKKSLKALDRLEKLYNILSVYGYENYVSFDLGMLSQYHYYTGIIFKTYTYGTGDAIVTGGRYDSLLKQFGKNSAAVGFAIDADRLMGALNRQKIEVSVDYQNKMILYKTSQQKEAIRLASSLRSKGERLVLMRKRSNVTEDEYIEYSKRMGIEEIYFIQTQNVVRVVNVANNSVSEKVIE